MTSKRIIFAGTATSEARIRVVLALLIAAAAFQFPAECQQKPAENPLRVQVITGGHAYDAEFNSVFSNRPDTKVAFAAHPDAYVRDLKSECDVLVLYDYIDKVDEAKQANLRSFLESGNGLVVLHHAIADFGDWPWWYKEVVGGKYLLAPENGMPGSTYKHDEDVYVDATGSHPITRGLAPLRLRDETYKGMWISPKANVLLKTNNATSDGPVAWISPYGKARVVYIQLGHDRYSFENPDYRELVHRAILWVAHRLN